MFTPRPPHRPPADATPEMRKWANQVIESLNASSRYVSNDVGGGLPTQGTNPWQFIYGQIILTSGGSGSGSSGSSGINLDPNGPGFFDDNGFLAYSFIEILEDFPWMGIVKPGGIKTNLKSSTGPGSNYAYPLNGEEISEGTNVLLKQVKNNWIIVGGEGQPGGSGSGSTGRGYIFTCNGDGTGGTIIPR